MAFILDKAGFYYGLNFVDVESNGVEDLPGAIDPDNIPLELIYTTMCIRSGGHILDTPFVEHNPAMPEFDIPETINIWGNGYIVTYINVKTH